MLLLSQVLAQSKQFIATYLERSSALLQPADSEHNNNGASAVAAAVQVQSQQTAENDSAVDSEQT